MAVDVDRHVRGGGWSLGDGTSGMIVSRFVARQSRECWSGRVDWLRRGRGRRRRPCGARCERKVRLVVGSDEGTRGLAVAAVVRTMWSAKKWQSWA